MCRTFPKAAPLRAGGFEGAGALEEAGPQVLAFPARLPCQMSSSSVLARVKWEDAESRCVTVALVAGPPQGNEAEERSPVSDFLPAAGRNGGHLEEGCFEKRGVGNRL